MEKELKKFIDEAFAPYGSFPAREDVTRELLVNLEEKYRDLKAEGKTDEEAYKLAVDSFGDVSEIMDEIEYKEEPELSAASTVHKFKGVALEEADLAGVNLTKADFSGSAIQKAIFDNANLTEAKLIASAISDASFVGANLTDTVFKSSDIRNANFSDAQLIRVQMKSSSLKSSTFHNVTITGATFKSSDFTGASFVGAMITDTIFTSCSLDMASFKDATLRNVSLHYSEVKKTIFDGTKMDKVTYAFLKKTKANLDNVIII